MRRFAVAIVVLAVSCAPAALAPTSASPARLVPSDAPLATSNASYLLFQLPGETRLRAITWDASVSGVLPGTIVADVVWSQSPYGAPYLVALTPFDRDGVSLGALPWQAKDAPTWSSNAKFLCAAVPERSTTTGRMRLETGVPGHGSTLIASGFAIYSDNATYPVLACDSDSDRAIVAVLGQGVAAARLWVFRLSNGAVVRSVDYSGSNVWVAASADGSLLAEAVMAEGGRTRTTIRRSDDGTELGAVDDFVAHGFSGDGSLIVGVAGANTSALVDWRTGRRIWASTGLPYGGFLSEPAGRHVAVGLGFASGSDTRDVYIVSPDGSTLLLPAGVRVSLRY